MSMQWSCWEGRRVRKRRALWLQGEWRNYQDDRRERVAHPTSMLERDRVVLGIDTSGRGTTRPGGSANTFGRKTDLLRTSRKI